MTPPERPNSELLVPLAGGSAGVLGRSVPGRPLGSAAAAPIAPRPTIAAATTHILRIAASDLAVHTRQTPEGAGAPNVQTQVRPHRSFRGAARALGHRLELGPANGG